jgi:hypothetical protein
LTGELGLALAVPRMPRTRHDRRRVLVDMDVMAYTGPLSRCFVGAAACAKVTGMEGGQSTGPTSAAKRVGKYLEDLRRGAGHSSTDVMARLGLRPGQVSLWEAGHGPLARTDLDRLMELYRAGPAVRSAIRRLYEGTAMTDGVFISYRRDDSGVLVGRLYDWIKTRFGPQRVFRDISSITPGTDFVQELEATLTCCTVMLAVIGPDWSTASDSAGHRRLDNPHDLVRQEIEVGLALDMFVIPVLVDGTSLPHGDELPHSLAQLVRRSSMALSSRAGFEADCKEILDAVDRLLAS